MIKYRDFSIRILPLEDETFRVHISSPAGDGSSSFELPATITDGLDERLSDIGQMLRGEETRGLTLGAERRQTSDPEQLGRQLFESVFQGTALSLFQQSMGMISGTGDGLRLRLIMDPAHQALAKFSRLPWELLCRNGTGEFLNLSNRSSLVRFLEVPRPYTPAPFKPPFRILVVISSPAGVAQLDLEKERSLIQQSWGRRSDVQVDFLESATTSELQRRLGQADYHALHFMGHGDFDAATGRGVLVLEKEDGSAEFVSGEALGILIADEPTLRLAFLNACNTAQTAVNSQQNPFAGVASALVMAGIPAVVAMQFPISDEAAIAFSETFYELLPRCHPVDYVVAEGRKAIYQLQETRGGMEWATPAVFMRLPDGVVFESVYRLEPLSGKDSNVFSRLGSKVRKFWIEGKLDHDIPIKPPIEMNKELVPQAIQRQMPGDDREEVPAGKTTATVFDEKERSLLILGEAGYGKTITMLALAQHLLQRYEQDQSQPIPVVLYLSTWADSKLSIQDWAAREVLEKYKVSDKLCTRWIESGRIVLMLDGLDELSEEHRVECIKAINEFSAEQIRRTNFHGVAVCCRFDDYECLPIRFDFEGAIRLQPLTPEQIKRYLSLFGESMAALEACLEREPLLLEDAQSPLMLGMLSVAYSLNPGEFSGLTEGASGETDSDARRELVMNTYLDRVFQRHPEDSAPFSRPKTVGYLTWLAKRLKEHHHSVFLIESLQPNWLRNAGERLLNCTLFSLMLAILVATTLAIVWHASVTVNPSKAARFTSVLAAHRWWFVVSPIWAFFAVLWEGWQINRLTRYFRRPSGALSGFAHSFLHYALAAISYLAIWYALWVILIYLVRGRIDWDWLSHPIQGGVSVAVLYALCGRRPNTSTYIGTTEALRWSWKRGGLGLLIGLAGGSVLWRVSDLFTGNANAAFFLPLWSVIGLLFGGLKMDEVKTKTRPNEGIVLSLKNSLLAAAIVGPLIGIALVPILMCAFPFEIDFTAGEGSNGIYIKHDVSQLPTDNLVNKLLPSLKLGIAVTLVAFWWYGGIHVFRHYALRLTLFLTGQLPWKLPALCDHASDLILLQRIGGGYIFRNHLLRDHFEQLSPNEATENGSAENR